jgi:hypothetical protein
MNAIAKTACASVALSAAAVLVTGCGHGHRRAYHNRVIHANHARYVHTIPDDRFRHRHGVRYERRRERSHGQRAVREVSRTVSHRRTRSTARERHPRNAVRGRQDRSFHANREPVARRERAHRVANERRAYKPKPRKPERVLSRSPRDWWAPPERPRARKSRDG